MADQKPFAQAATKDLGLLADDSLEESSKQGRVSFHAEVPGPLQEAMASFIERHPNWDQYRLVQAALAGFLVQNGMDSRSITRLYVGNMFTNTLIES